MLNTKLFTLLQTFSRFDFQRFRKYLVSPFFNENQDLVSLFDIIQDEFPPDGKTNQATAKLGLWKKLFPKTPYDDTRFRRLCSDMLKLALDFLAYQQFKLNPSTMHILQLKALEETRLDKHYDGIVRQAEHELEKAGLRNTGYHFFNYLLHFSNYKHLEHTGDIPASLGFLDSADLHLDAWYFSKKLEHYCDALGYQNKLAGVADIRLIPGFMEYLPGSGYLKEPSVKAYYLVALMMLHQEEEHYFRELKNMLEKDAAFFQKRELQALFIHLMNYCIDTKINNGRTDYYAELLSLYGTALEKEIIFDNDELNPHHYKNIITVALQVEEFGWVENFIQKYTGRLPKTDQENALNYNLAQVYFHKKEYGKVIEQLREVEYQTLVYALGSKLLLLRTYYELREYFALDSLIDSFRIYLRRHKLISKDVKQQYMNMLRFIKKLSSLAHYDKQSIEKLKAQIENCKALAAKKWLLEKVEEV